MYQNGRVIYSLLSYKVSFERKTLTMILPIIYIYIYTVYCLYVQPIYTPLGYCRHVTLDVFWLKGKRRSETSKLYFHGSA